MLTHTHTHTHTFFTRTLLVMTTGVVSPLLGCNPDEGAADPGVFAKGEDPVVSRCWTTNGNNTFRVGVYAVNNLYSGKTGTSACVSSDPEHLGTGSYKIMGLTHPSYGGAYTFRIEPSNGELVACMTSNGGNWYCEGNTNVKRGTDLIGFSLTVDTDLDNVADLWVDISDVNEVNGNVLGSGSKIWTYTLLSEFDPGDSNYLQVDDKESPNFGMWHTCPQVDEDELGFLFHDVIFIPQSKFGVDKEAGEEIYIEEVPKANPCAEGFIVACLNGRIGKGSWRTDTYPYTNRGNQTPTRNLSTYGLQSAPPNVLGAILNGGGGTSYTAPGRKICMKHIPTGTAAPLWDELNSTETGCKTAFGMPYANFEAGYNYYGQGFCTNQNGNGHHREFADPNHDIPAWTDADACSSTSAARTAGAQVVVWAEDGSFNP